VPVIADPAEVEFHTRRRGRRRVYRIAPAGSAVTRARIATVVDALHASGAIIGLAPELTLDRELLGCWQQALRARTRSHPGGRLLWVLAGSGDVDGGDPPANTAVLLDARSGAIVARQDKLFPFNFDRATLARWRLDARLGSDPVDEDLRRGERLTVIEAGGGVRLAMLVCEDASRVQDLGPVVRDFGVSHVLAPVFSRPIKPHRWEQVAAAAHLRETGSTVIVSNSLIMHSILGDQRGGTALAAWPGLRSAVIGGRDDPAQIVSFTLGRDGTAALS
jgi:predicted amidohydrolase